MFLFILLKSLIFKVNRFFKTISLSIIYGKNEPFNFSGNYQESDENKISLSLITYALYLSDVCIDWLIVDTTEFEPYNYSTSNGPTSPLLLNTYYVQISANLHNCSEVWNMLYTVYVCCSALGKKKSFFRLLVDVAFFSAFES